MSEKTTLEGVLERIVYFNEENSFTVARLQSGHSRDLITIVGNLPGPNPGETLRLKGEWIVDAKFGNQFRVESCISVLPSTLTGIEKYLGSGLVKGIGPVMAGRVVAKFGLETLEVIEGKPEGLLEVEGIGKIRAERIGKTWQEQKEIRDVMVFLQGNGVSSTYAVKIYKAYGNKSISIVKENPYRLALDISGIGFKTADRIAQNMGIDPGAQIRIEAGTIHVLSELVNEGHVYYPKDKLIDSAAELLEVELTKVEVALAALVKQRLIVIEKQGDEEAVYLTPLHVAEVNVAKRLETLINAPRQMFPINIEKAIQWVQSTIGMNLAEMQQEAIKKAVTSKVLVITGGPGTGKTTLLNCLLWILEKKNQRILMASPTGRAAKRLTEVTGREAKTIHRLLEYSPREGGFKRNEDNLLEADLVIIDEVSMMDILLMNHLLKAIPPIATLLLVGDVDQLPSVGPGNVLRDIIASGRVETVKLTEVFRQAQESMIIVNAHRINRCEFPVAALPQDKKADFYFIERDDPDQALALIKELCAVRLPKSFHLDSRDDIQVMTPMHRGLVGVSNLNAELQTLLNPTGKEVIRAGRCFRINDKVMQIVNNYEKEVFNGDIGRVVGIEPEEQKILIRYDDRVIDYGWNELDELVLAYAISIHKSQGSEYPAVVVPILSQHYIMLQRNLLYTAITRAKKLVILVGSRKAMAIAIRNNKVQHRYTGLADRLAATDIRNIP
ncbi:MAG: ATP-dependent RecD-like DNA helicase [Dehalococcoidales bacterium]|nr:ATP-dependent RecD-like DNA helicase [Dehalococcoidales bacterium]